MKPNTYDNDFCLKNTEEVDYVVTKTGAIRRLGKTDVPLLSIAEVKRFATKAEINNYEQYKNKTI